MKTRYKIITIFVILIIGFLVIPFYVTNYYCDFFEPTNGGCIRIAGIGIVDYTWLPYFVIDDEPNCDEICPDFTGVPFGETFVSKFSDQQCAEFFDKIFDTWREYVNVNYGGPDQPTMEPPTVQGLIAGWEGGDEFRNSDCRYTVNDWAYLVKHQDHVWGHVDWPTLEPFYTEPELKLEISCDINQVILYDNCVYVLSPDDIPPKHDRYFIQVDDIITKICREAWGNTSDEKCHDITSYTITEGIVVDMHTDDE